MGLMTPPTQKITGGRVGPRDGQRVADEDSLGADQNVFHDQPEDLLATLNGGSLRRFLQPAKEALQAFRERYEAVDGFGAPVPAHDLVPFGLGVRARRGRSVARLNLAMALSPSNGL